MADNTWTANRRLYLDKNGKAVEADDPARVSLLVAAGATIPLAQARALGLVEERAATVTLEAKLRPGPIENKARDTVTPGADEGTGTPEQLARFQAMTIPPEQRTPEQQALLDNAPLGQPEHERTPGTQAEEPARRKRGQ